MAQLKCILDQSYKATQRKKVGRLYDELNNMETFEDNTLTTLKK